MTAQAIPIFEAVDQATEAESAARYAERVRLERFKGRMFVLAIADDAWARYGWARPKVARR